MNLPSTLPCQVLYDLTACHKVNGEVPEGLFQDLVGDSSPGGDTLFELATLQEVDSQCVELLQEPLYAVLIQPNWAHAQWAVLTTRITIVQATDLVSRVNELPSLPGRAIPVSDRAAQIMAGCPMAEVFFEHGYVKFVVKGRCNSVPASANYDVMTGPDHVRFCLELWKFGGLSSIDLPG